MTLVDLDKRLDDPAIQRLFGSEERADPPVTSASNPVVDHDRRIIGWEEEGRILACASLFRCADGAIDVRVLTLGAESDSPGSNRALLEELAEIANAPALVADIDGEAVVFYEACGFTVEPTAPPKRTARFRCVRVLDAVPDALAGRGLTLSALEGAIRSAWSAETSDDPRSWSADNPARHQCGVTALVVRDLLGGEILAANVGKDGRRIERHAWNRLPSGIEINLTGSQFRNGEQLSTPRVSDPDKVGRSSPEYKLFAARVQEALRTQEEAR